MINRQNIGELLNQLKVSTASDYVAKGNDIKEYLDYCLGEIKEGSTDSLLYQFAAFVCTNNPGLVQYDYAKIKALAKQLIELSPEDPFSIYLLYGATDVDKEYIGTSRMETLEVAESLFPFIKSKLYANAFMIWSIGKIKDLTKDQKIAKMESYYQAILSELDNLDADDKGYALNLVKRFLYYKKGFQDVVDLSEKFKHFDQLYLSSLLKLKNQKEVFDKGVETGVISKSNGRVMQILSGEIPADRLADAIDTVLSSTSIELTDFLVLREQPPLLRYL